jgi:indolepyruvate ferredoxin oxidoreductase
VTGVGGTGVVTIGALLGMAAHLESKGCSVLDMTGLAQKNGAVVSHVRIGDTPEKLYATRIAAGEASLILACDILTSVGNEALAKMQKGVTKALVNTALVMPAQFTREPISSSRWARWSRRSRTRSVPATPSSSTRPSSRTALMGDSIATNLFMVGYAYQRGLIPVTEPAIMKAIELNGAAIESNKLAFRWGRLAAVDPAKVAAAAMPRQGKPESLRLSESLDEMIARRVKFLTDYQDAKYAERYPRSSRKCARPKRARCRHHRAHRSGRALLLQALAIKDEYEVARLYAETDFVKRVAAQFEGDYQLNFHLAPPIFNKPDPVTGVPRKSSTARG